MATASESAAQPAVQVGHPQWTVRCEPLVLLAGAGAINVDPLTSQACRGTDDVHGLSPLPRRP
jgi:hypothetical protein